AGEVFDLDHIEDAMALLTRSVPGRDAVRVGLKHTHPSAFGAALAWHTHSDGAKTRAGTVSGMLYINGEWRDATSGATFASTNPATGDEIGRAAECGGDRMSPAGEAAASP